MRSGSLTETKVLCGLDDIRVSEGVEAASDEGRSSDSDGPKYGEKESYEPKKDLNEDSMVR